MESANRTIMGLRLILAEFGINVGETLKTKSNPNMDLICSCISLLQMLHPMQYKFELVFIAGRHRIRSTKLSTEIEILQRKGSQGHLTLLERQYKLNSTVEEKIGALRKEIKAHDVPFSLPSWVFFLGFYNIVFRVCDKKAVIEILMRDYLDFLPYIDLAEETIGSIQYNNV